ncbi:MAG: threonine synthase [Nitrososphaerota archaeon]|jgi:threonine synthase|uniref:threonine synthase n=1 Tax=Candidatus Bathycorpusculum sp. TaxID=2994959 RepID=UPI00281771D2|nr:threonine synthase [Candidatus Termitimicrobium sp.]MCL2431160.1 threonine synthase [Candidatus Termitimicrobium sp.]MDR0492362.1 threonine synthase [Nitrososphaerota archaeon]
MAHQDCINCKTTYGIDEVVYFCKKCGDILEIKFDPNELAENAKAIEWKTIPLSVWRYRPFMPIHESTRLVTLGEGGTGLHRSERLGAELGIQNLYIKNEGENPTGSFKDRGMTVGVTKAVELGARHVICASTGNTSASLAAYAARAGIRCTVLIPSGKIAYGKLSQAMIHGAKVLQVRGNFDEALEFVFKLSEKHRDIYLLNSINPFRVEGQKSLGYEICDQLNYEAPDRIIIPVGNAGNISAVWKGLTEFYQLGLIKKLPKMTGIQAQGSAPIAQAIQTDSDQIIPVQNPETIATAIRIGAPVSWKKAINAIRESHGTAEIVTDDEILDAQKTLARIEGIFVEPASASSIAGLKKLIKKGVVANDEKVVCITTGHGLKDPDTAIKQSDEPIEVDADIGAIEAALGLKKAILAR